MEDTSEKEFIQDCAGIDPGLSDLAPLSSIANPPPTKKQDKETGVLDLPPPTKTLNLSASSSYRYQKGFSSFAAFGVLDKKCIPNSLRSEHNLKWKTNMKIFFADNG